MRFLKLVSTSAGVVLALVLCVGVTHAQQNDQLTGKWNMLSKTPEGNDISWTLSITYKDGAYAATVAGDQGDSATKDLRVEGSKVHIRVPYQGNDYDIDLKLTDDKLIGTWSGNGDSGPTKGEKADR